MKNMKYFITGIFTFLIISQNMCFSQIAGGKVLSMPGDMIVPKQESVMESAFTNFIPGNTWIVFSDRTSNRTYTMAYGHLIYKILDFMEWFYVLETKDDYLHLIKDDSIDEYGNVSVNAIDYGWIEAKNLLLWRHCLVNEDSDDNLKVLTIVPAENDLITGLLDDNLINRKVFLNPDLTNDKQNDLFPQHEIYYAYKIVEDAILIGLSPYFRKSDGGVIKGWIAKNQILLWNDKNAIEPSFSFEDTLSVSCIFIDPISAQKNNNNEFIDDKYLSWRYRLKDKNIKGIDLRFPVLKEINKDVYKVCIVGMIGKNANANEFGDYNASFTDYLRLMGFSEFNLQRLSGNNVFVYDIGYASIKPGITGFKRVLLFDLFELSEKLDLLKKWAVSLRMNNSGEYFQEIVGDELKIKFQQKERSYFYDYTFDDITRTLFGTPCQSAYMKSKTLKELTRSVEFNNEDFQFFLNRLNNNVTELENIIQTKPVNIFFKSNNIEYYWIDIKLFP